MRALGGNGVARDAFWGAALLAGLLVLPILFRQPALRDFLIYVMAYGLLAMSLNLLIGLTGLVAFGHAAFFGSGAYIFGLTMQSGRVTLPAALVHGVVTRTFRVARALEAGMVGINQGIITTEVAPFGGIKDSGIGREGSRLGIEEFLAAKYMSVGGL